MNTIKSVLTFIPALLLYLKGVNAFNSRDFSMAILQFNKCIDHPKFKNELLYAHYGQSLCALGRFEEAYGHLMAAHEKFKTADWNSKNSEHRKSLAEGTLSALRHISKYSDIDVPKEIIENK